MSLGAAIATYGPGYLAQYVNGANPPSPAAAEPVMVTVAPAPAAPAPVAPAPAAPAPVEPVMVTVSPAPEAPASSVLVPEMTFGDPGTIDKLDNVTHEVINFRGDPAVLDYNVRAASKNIVPGTLMWAERRPDSSVDVHLVVKTGLDGATWYNLRHEFYVCRQWGGPYTEEPSVNFVPFAAVKVPREVWYRTGSSTR
jgi:hypothetical protein